MKTTFTNHLPIDELPEQEQVAIVYHRIYDYDVNFRTETIKHVLCYHPREH